MSLPDLDLIVIHSFALTNQNDTFCTLFTIVVLIPIRLEGPLFSTPEIHKAIKAAAESGNWIPTKHAQERMVQRGFSAVDVEGALRGGVHDSSLDELKNNVWRYRIRGQTMEGKVIQLAIIIDSPVVVVTVIG